MNTPDHSLQRLFRAASLASKEMPASPPSALESKVLAQWRSAGTEDEFASLVNLLRRAAVFAGFIMVLSMGWNWMQSRNDNAGQTALANYAVSVELLP